MFEGVGLCLPSVERDGLIDEWSDGDGFEKRDVN